MEQTTAFVLGVLSVLALVGVYRIVKVAFRVKDLQEDIDDVRCVINEIEADLGQTSDLLDRRIDGEIDRVDNLIEELYKYIDSRTDKMESRCDSKFKEVETPPIIKGLKLYKPLGKGVYVRRSGRVVECT